MSTRQLTELQTEIIDALANDYEDLAQIHAMVGSDLDRSEIVAALWELIEMGYVLCYESTRYDMIPVKDPEEDRLRVFWFGLSDAGETFLATLEAAS